MDWKNFIVEITNNSSLAFSNNSYCIIIQKSFNQFNKENI